MSWLLERHKGRNFEEIVCMLRVLGDRPQTQARFLILGSASPILVKDVSETLAGRIEFVELAGFDLRETSPENWQPLWLRGGFPRSYLASSDADSVAWREGFIRTFLERDIPQLGITIPAAALRRFWTMLAHYHGQVWNASELGRIENRHRPVFQLGGVSTLQPCVCPCRQFPKAPGQELAQNDPRLFLTCNTLNNDGIA